MTRQTSNQKRIYDVVSKIPAYLGVVALLFFAVFCTHIGYWNMFLNPIPTSWSTAGGYLMFSVAALSLYISFDVFYRACRVSRANGSDNISVIQRR